MLQEKFRKAGGERSLYRACLTIALRARAGERYPDDPVVEMVVRAAQSPTSMADVPELATVIAEFVESLTSYSAAASLFNLSLNLSFGRAGMLSLPMVSDLPMADWVREGAPIPVVMGRASGVPIEPYKMATIVALTNEMMLSSSAEAVMRQALMDNMGPALDLSLFSDAAGVPGLRPPGLINGVATETASTNTNLNEAMIEDMQTLVAALTPYGGNGNIVFIAPPAPSVRMKKIEFGQATYPVFVADQPNLIAVAARAFAVAIDPPSIEISDQATLHMNDAPLPIVDDAGVLAVPVRSTWQTDSTGLKFRLPVSWALRAPAVAWLTPLW